MGRHPVLALGALCIGLFSLTLLGMTTSVGAQDTLEERVAALERQLGTLEERVAALERGAITPTEGTERASAQGSPGDLQLTFEGTTDTITDPFMVQEGVVRVDAEYGGDGNFAVWIYGPAGSRDLVINEIGPYQGEKVIDVAGDQGLAIGVRAGEVFFEVTGDGPWRISVEQ